MSLALELNRRVLLGTIGAAVATTMLPAALAAAGQKLENEEGIGNLLAWLRVAPDGVVRVSVATSAGPSQDGYPWRSIVSEQDIAITSQRVGGHVSLLAWKSRQDAVAATRTLLTGLAANQWNVMAADCALRQSHIVHAPSGHQSGYRIWVQVA